MKNAESCTAARGSGVGQGSATWFEIGAVLALMLAPSVASLSSSLFWGSAYRRIEQGREIEKVQTAAAFDATTFDSLIVRLRYVPILLFIIWRSGAGWSRFGLVKPDLAKDLLIGIGLWLVVACLSALTAMAFDRGQVWVSLLPAAVPGLRTVLLVAECCAIGFTEELAFRAYLIPRVEAMMGSTRKAVLLSVLVFAIAHFSNGYVAAIHSLITGSVFAVAFCSTRRIWPVAIGHSFVDLIVTTHLAAMAGTLPAGLVPHS